MLRKLDLNIGPSDLHDWSFLIVQIAMLMLHMSSLHRYLSCCHYWQWMQLKTLSNCDHQDHAPKKGKCWEKLGKYAMQHFSTPVTPCFMLGPLGIDTTPKIRKIAVRQKRVEGATTKPSEVLDEGAQADGVRTTREAEQVLKILQVHRCDKYGEISGKYGEEIQTNGVLTNFVFVILLYVAIFFILHILWLYFGCPSMVTPLASPFRRSKLEKVQRIQTMTVAHACLHCASIRNHTRKPWRTSSIWQSWSNPAMLRCRRQMVLFSWSLSGCGCFQPVHIGFVWCPYAMGTLWKSHHSCKVTKAWCTHVV